MIEPNTINKIKNFSDNRKDSGYQLEPPSGISPSVIIFGEKHTDKKQIELLRSHLPTQELEQLENYGFRTETIFDKGVQKFPCLMQLFYNVREKEMGEIICSNHSIEPSKPIVAIIGHYHARQDSEVREILKKAEIDHIRIWNEKAVQEVKEKYQFFRRNSVQDSDVRL